MASKPIKIKLDTARQLDEIRKKGITLTYDQAIKLLISANYFKELSKGA